MNPGSSISADQFRRLLEVTRLLAVTSNLDELLQRIAVAATEILACERASIFLHDEAANQLWTKIALQSKEIRVPSTAGIVGAAFTSNALLHVAQPYDDPRFNPEPDRKSGFVTRNLLTCPMVDIDGYPVGVVQAVNKKASSFEPSDEAMIQLLADQAGVAIQRYNLQQRAIEATALRREMDLAKEVQLALIPDAPPIIPGVLSAGYTKAASITGGDAYDLWQTRDGRLGLFVGDATGHGIGPALVVSQARTLVRALCDAYHDPRDLLECVNARLADDLDAGKFVTAFLGFIAPDGQLHWCSAGHGPILIRQGAGQKIIEFESTAPPLGIVAEFLATPTESMQLAPGGMICVTSDGIAEAFAPDGTQFGAPRLVQLLEEHANADGVQLIAKVQHAVEQWERGGEPKDDQTMVIASHLPA